VQVKRAILNGLMAARDTDHLLQVAKSEKEPMLRRTAIQALGSMDSPQTADALVAIYASETDLAIKRNILDSLHGQRNAKAIVDLARKETDPAMKREIVSRLSNMKSKEASDYLMELLK
jgi:HEAT repeat protein